LQVMHGNNPEDAAALREKLNGIYDATWLPTESIAPVFGAHTGPGLVGVVYGPQEVFDDLP
jgi:fatty acid-binding protein DegV